MEYYLVGFHLGDDNPVILHDIVDIHKGKVLIKHKRNMFQYDLIGFITKTIVINSHRG